MDKYQAQDTDKLSAGEAKFLKIFGKWFLRIGGSVIFIIFISLALLLGRLSFGPLDLNFLKPQLEEAIHSAEMDLDVKFESVEMVWERWLRPYEIVVKGINISDSSSEGDDLSIDEIGLSLWLEKLIAGRFEIRNLFIYSPKLILNRNPETGFMLKLNGNNERDIASFDDLAPIFILGQGAKKLGPLSNINKIAVSGAKVTLQDDIVGEVWTLPECNFILNRYPDGFRVRTKLKSPEAQLFSRTVEVELKHRLGSSRIDLAVDLKKANFAELIESNKQLIFDDKTQETEIEKVLQFLYGFDFPVQGRIHLAVVPSTGQFIEGEVLLQTGAGSLTIRDQKLHLNEISLHADIDHSQINIDRLQLQLGDTKLTAKIMHQSDANPLLIHEWFQEGATFNISLTASKLSLDTISQLWPTDVASEAREWVTEEIREGFIPSLNFHTKSHMEAAGEFVVDKLGGDFLLRSLRINYLEGLPHAMSVDGTAKFDLQGFQFKLDNAKLLGLKLSKGMVLISGLDADDEKLELDLDLSGPLADVLEVIDHDPLGYAKMAKLDPKVTTGEGDINLKMSFPLLADLKFDDINLDCRAKFDDVATTINFGKEPLKVDKGRLQIFVDEKHLMAEGKAGINNLSSKLKGLIYFTDAKPKPWDVQIVVDTFINEAELKEHGYDYVDYINGVAESKFTFENYGKDNSTLAINFGLKEMKIHVPQVGWFKPKGEPGSLGFTIHIGPRGFDKVKDISFHSDYVTAKGTADFDDQEEIRGIYLTSVQAPNTNADMSVIFNDQGGYDLHFEGQRVDAEPFMEYIEKGQNGPPITRSFPVSISSNVSILRMKEGASFRDVNAAVQLYVTPDNVRWDKVHLNAAAGSGTSSNGRMGDESGGISLDILPDADGNKHLKVFANDAGQLFKNLDIYDNVLGGQMEVTAVREPGQPYTGEFKIQNFDAQQIPLAGRLASVLSPMGIVNLFSGDGRLTVDSFTCDFTLSDEQVTFKGGIGKSIGLGFTAQGTMDRVNRQFDIKGNMIPAYVLNSILDNIPIVGSLITGGKGEGLFAIAYTIDGSMDDPNVNVNPLTALAPGFIRNLFGD